MHYVDNITQGLGNKILQDINEDNAFTRGLKSVGNAALSALGSNSARGRLKHQRATSYLIGKWKEYTAIGKKPWTYNTLYNFLAKTFNPDVAGHLRDVLFTTPDQSVKPQDTDQSITANQNPQNSAGTMSFGAPRSDTPTKNVNVTGQGNVSFNSQKQPTSSINSNTSPNASPSPARDPQQNDLRTLNSELAKSDPSKTDVMKLVYNLLKAAKSKNISTNRKDDIIANLKNIQRKFATKVPQLNQIPAIESHQRIFDFAQYLIENRITSKYDIGQIYNFFFLTEDSFTWQSKPVEPIDKVSTGTDGRVYRQVKDENGKINYVPEEEILSSNGNPIQPFRNTFGKKGTASASASIPQRSAFGRNITRGGTPATPGTVSASSPSNSPCANIGSGNTMTTSSMTPPTQSTITGTPTTAQAAPTKAAKPRTLSSSEINNFFEKIAVVMLDNGGMSVDDPQWTKKTNNVLNRAFGGSNGGDGGGDSVRNVQSNRTQHSEPDQAQINIDNLSYEFQKLKTKLPNNKELNNAMVSVNSIVKGNRNITIAKLMDMLSKDGIHNNYVINAIRNSQRQ